MSLFTSVMVRGSEPDELVRECARRLGVTEPASNFGVLYLSDRLAPDMEGIVEGLKLSTGVQSWVGGVAMGVCGSDGECFDRSALSVMVGHLPADAFRTFALPQDSRDGGLDGDWARLKSPPVALVHADPRDPAVATYIEQIGAECFVLGGLLSSRGRYVHVADRVREGGLSGVLFAPEVAIATQLSQGCRPLGARHTVTRADGPLLQELDHRAALDVLSDDLAADKEADGEGFERDTRGVHIAFILPGDDARDYLVRNLVGMEPEQRSLVVGDQVLTGQRVMFCRRDPASAEADLRQMLSTLKRRLSGPPRGAIYVSCLARGPNLFDSPGLECALIAQTLGECPLVGFFANGEFARDRIYAYTGVLTVFT